MKRLSAIGFGALLVGLLAAGANAQGLLLVSSSDRVPLPRPSIRSQPQPPMSYKIKELSVNARLVDQVARVQVSQSFVNTGSRQMEVAFVFPLPYDGAIDRLTFMVDGKEFPAKLLPAKEARAIYESHVRKNQDPALLEWLGKGMFKTSVFPVPAGAERTVTLRYSQLLRKDHNLTDFLFPLGTAKYTSAPVEKVEIKVTIESSIKIKNVYSPTHSIKVDRSGKRGAQIVYSSKNVVPTADFRLFFSVAKGRLGANVISYRPAGDENGYFLLLASPEIKSDDAERPPKNVVCVFDRSGSMSGEKIKQAREALKFILNNLRKGDLFNVIAYDSDIESFKPELQRYNDKTRKQALGFVEGLFAGGATNIDGALNKAMSMLQDTSRPNFIIFMTDGQPTMGETNEAKIVERAKGNNKVRARLISFGVGYDVNSRLLDRLSRANYGQSEFVRPNEDIETQVSRLYSKISSPAMTDVAVDFEFDSLKTEQGPPIVRVYPKEVNDLFEGEQLVMVGRYKLSGLAKVKISGKVGTEARKFDFTVKLAKKSADQSYAFVEKLWAMRRIGEIIDELDLKGRNEELVKELVTLSTKHGVLTPYTSFLADETAAPGELALDRPAAARKASGLLGRLEETEGMAAFAQRDLKKQLLEAKMPQPSVAVNGIATGSMMRDIDSDKDVSVQAVQVVGGKVLYKRGSVWYSFDVAKRDVGKLAGKTKTVKRFSKAYFEMLDDASPADAKVLAQQKAGEDLMLEIDGKVYEVK